MQLITACDSVFAYPTKKNMNVKRPSQLRDEQSAKCMNPQQQTAPQNRSSFIMRFFSYTNRAIKLWKKRTLLTSGSVQVALVPVVLLTSGSVQAKVCIDQKFRVIPIPGPSAVVTALAASGLPTNEFSFVGFLPIQSNARRKRLMTAANEAATQIFYVPPHKLHQFLEESISIFGESRCCVIAREMTKLHEEFWRGTLAEAKNEFSQRNPRGEITLLIQGQESHDADAPSESELESELQYLVLSGHSISEAVKLVSEGMNVKRKLVYAIALKMHESRCKLQNNVQGEDVHA